MTVDEDYVVCGLCNETFPLDRLSLFMQHKRFDCDEKPNTGESKKYLWCGSCLEKFDTPWSLMKHAQSVHAIRIFLQNNTAPLNQIPLANVDTLQTQEAKISALQANLIALQEEINGVVLKQNENTKQTPSKENMPITAVPSHNYELLKISNPEIKQIQSVMSTMKNPMMTNPQKISHQSSITSTATLVPKTGLPQAAGVGAVLPQTTAPVHVNIGNAQMSVLVSKPQTKTIAISSGKVSNANSMANKPRVFKTITKGKTKPTFPQTQVTKVVQVSRDTLTTLPAAAAAQSFVKASNSVSTTKVPTTQPVVRVANSVFKTQQQNLNIKFPVTTDTGKIVPHAETVVTSKMDAEVPSDTSPSIPVTRLDQNVVDMKMELSSSLHTSVAPMSTRNPITSAGQVLPMLVQDLNMTTRALSSDISTPPTQSKSPKVIKSSTTPEEGVPPSDNTKKDENGLCCDDQDCGVTVMPGTHEKLQECCNAVVPKKRKRHMETKHWGYIKSARKKYAPKPVKKATESTIYIDFEHIDPPKAQQTSRSELHPSGILFDSSEKTASKATASVAFGIDNIQTSKGALKVKQGDTSSEHSVIIPAGATFSIPLGYTVGSASTSTGLAMNPSTSTRITQGIVCDTSAVVQGIKQELVSPRMGDPPEDLPQEEQKYSNLADIRQKRRRYPTSRPFKCDECEHSFNQRIHLKKHKSKHTGIKPFKCEQCDYSTVERSHLKVHIRVHTGEKPYKCTYCEYATAQNSTLKIHLKRHHSIRVTNKSSNRKLSATSLAATSSTATATVTSQSHQCATCNQMFPNKNVLDEHMKQHNPDNE